MADPGTCEAFEDEGRRYLSAPSDRNYNTLGSLAPVRVAVPKAGQAGRAEGPPPDPVADLVGVSVGRAEVGLQPVPAGGLSKHRVVGPWGRR